MTALFLISLLLISLVCAFHGVPLLGWSIALVGTLFAFGYGGHGLHSALYCGREVASLITGEKTSSPFMEIPHQTYFFYRNKPWFLPFAAYYYRFIDWVS